MTKEIQLTRNKVALVDDADYEWLNQWSWCVGSVEGRSYAVRQKGKRPFRKKVKMHREITNAPAGMEVDHIDGNGLNNTRGNLRVCTHTENTRNRGKQKNNSSGYKGVTWDKHIKKYHAKISVFGKTIHLGHFDDPAEAARVRDLATKKYHGPFAKLNFPE